jgi:hypothetical protein
MLGARRNLANARLAATCAQIGAPVRIKSPRRKIMLRCKGLFYACKDGAEARRFNRLLIDAGLVRGL